jgi:hypothetical protein
MNRRTLLKLLASGVIGHTLDIDRLPWVPGEKSIFIPSATKIVTESDIVAIEIERVLPYIRAMFERDDIFWRKLR